MEILQMDQGLTITSAPAESPIMVAAIMGEGYAIEKNPTPLARIAINAPAPEIVLANTDEALQSDRFAPYVFESPEETDTAVTGEDKDAVVGLIETDGFIRPLTTASLIESAMNQEDAPVAEDKREPNKMLAAIRRSKLGRVASVAAITVGGILSFGASSAKADSSLQQECVTDGMATPTVLAAKMYDPGSENQAVKISIYRDPMPPECVGVYDRYMDLRVQMQNYKNHRKEIIIGNNWAGAVGDLTDTGGAGGPLYSQNSHTKADNYHCTGGPGVKDGITHVRLEVKNTVENASGNIVAGPEIRKFPVTVYRNHRRGC